MSAQRTSPLRLTQVATRRLLPLLVAGVLTTLACGHEIVNSEPRGRSIICFGDSLTAGTGAGDPELTYPAQLARRLGQPVINAGIPGDTTGRALERLDRDVLQHTPRLVLITLGGNDLLAELPTEQVFTNLETIIRRIQARGALVVVGGIDVPLLGRGYGTEYRKLCRRTGAVLVANVFEHIMGHSNLMADRIHPNGKGYAIMADHFAEAVEPYLE